MTTRRAPVSTRMLQSVAQDIHSADVCVGRGTSSGSSNPNTHQGGAATSGLYCADRALRDPALDRFDRLPFARSVAETLADLVQPDGLVIGIYGTWGSGKTTVLNYIERELGNKEHIVCVRFDPWLYGDVETLLLGFFESLAAALKKSLRGHAKQAADKLLTLGKLLRGLSVPLGLATFNVGDAAVGLAEQLSCVKLEDMRKSIERILAQEKTRVVVLIDDLDRLENSEIQAVIKLVKLCADFNFVAYVLAFDEDMVAAALGETYGEGSTEAGRCFLQKIVQVPLYLPPPDPATLAEVCLEGADAALRSVGIQLSDRDQEDFYMSFTYGLAARVQTPRMANRYRNALAFALPLLKDEVHPVDLMLVEGLRVFYPELYSIISEHLDTFAGVTYQAATPATAQCSAILAPLMDTLPTDTAQEAQRLLACLFPHCAVEFKKPHLRQATEQQLLAEKRIASAYYIRRYFAYSVPHADVPDRDLDRMLAQLQLESPDELNSLMQQLVGRNPEALVAKLQVRMASLLPATRDRLALMLARVGDGLPRPETETAFTSPFWQGALLVSKVLGEPLANGRADPATDIAESGEPIIFAYECLRRAIDAEDTTNEAKPADAERRQQLQAILVNRIRGLALEGPLYSKVPRDTPMLLHLWSSWGSREETNTHISAALQQHPQDVVAFVDCYRPVAINLETGTSRKIPLEKSQYERIGEHVDLDSVYDAFRRTFGEAMKPIGEYEAPDLPPDLLLAGHFARLHQQASALQATARTSPVADGTSDPACARDSQ